LGIEKSLATGANTKVETDAFLDGILQTSKLRPNLDE
jgi:hypothetical protein